jgi:hypothetical protein
VTPPTACDATADGVGGASGISFVLSLQLVNCSRWNDSGTTRPNVPNLVPNSDIKGRNIPGLNKLRTLHEERECISY